MHPAFSVIIFTTFSGMGYGLFVWLCGGLLFEKTGLNHHEITFGAALSTVLVGVGLISSTLHLGHPERAWRAFSQWRSSWLSREGILSVLTFGPIMAIGTITFFEVGFNDFIKPLAFFGILGSIATLYTTSMIYASLKAIPAWHNGWVILGYQIYALSSGGVAYIMISGVDLSFFVVIILLSALIVKIATWIHIDKHRGQYTRESALGLTDFGKAKPFEPAHSQKNYLEREMGYDISPKKRIIIRWTALGCGFLLPAVMLYMRDDTAILATLICLIGMMAERWLFFAEAEHVVRLYYDRDTV